MTNIPWQEACRLKKAQQGAAIPAQWKLRDPPSDDVLDVRGYPEKSGILTPKELEITALDDVEVLLKRLASGQWSSVEVTTAYIKRAIIAQQLVNCLTEFWIEDALAQAEALDEHLKTKGPKGPLHGLPFSLKDQFHVKGKELNMGYASWLGQISKDDAALVKVLRNSGVVIYARTNVPQTLMRTETANHVYGVTVSPFNRTLTCGGSSGGEGALLALKGSPLGVGTDIGGSVRVPSSFNGLYGLRPTMRRVPYGGAANSMLGLEAIESSAGPMARTLNGCAVFLKTIANGEPSRYDHKVVEMPWRESLYKLEHLAGMDTKLCIAVFDDDGVIQPAPPIRRAIKEVTEKLQKAGHKVIQWNPEHHEEMVQTGFEIYSTGAGEDFKDTMRESGETYIGGMDVTSLPIVSSYEAWKINRKRDHYRDLFHERWWATAEITGTGRPIDGLICPVAASPPPPLNKNNYTGYTVAFNLLDWPSVTIPVTTVDPALDKPYTDFKPRSDLDQEFYDFYTPEALKNAPVGVQLVGRRWREEELLGIAGIVDKALGPR